MRAPDSFQIYDDFRFRQLPPSGDFWSSITGAARRILYPRRNLAWLCSVLDMTECHPCLGGAWREIFSQNCINFGEGRRETKLIAREGIP